MARISIAVQTADFNLGEEYNALSAADAAIGAVVAFVGRVRDLNVGRDIAALSLEHYPGMTEKSLQAIAEQACERWRLNAVRIVHRVGELMPNDQIVLVLTASAHRHAAFDGNSFIMDYLKTQAPFWKKEYAADGSAHWVEAKESDNTAASRWDQVLAERYGISDHD